MWFCKHETEFVELVGYRQVSEPSLCSFRSSRLGPCVTPFRDLLFFYLQYLI